jgi:Cu(I)/Ag(I) efflux system membrane fusion protein
MRFLLVGVLTSGLLVMYSSCSKQNETGARHGETGSAVTPAITKTQEYYTCPMHPSVISDRPGACPVCGMALVKKSAPKNASDAELALIEGVSLSQAQRVIANVSTIRAERGSLKRVINAVGVVGYAEPLQAKVAARFRGRIEKLYVDYTGEVVHKGQPLFELYSPDLVSAEQELILAVNAIESSAATNGNAESEQPLLQAARDRLRTHYGFTEEQITEVETSKHVRTAATFTSPIQGTVISKEVQQGQYVDEGMLLYQLIDLSRVWIYLDVYEQDVRLIAIGQVVEITSEAYPNESFTGRVTFIDPVVSSETRTLRVRTEFDNPGGKLKPQMYVKAEVSIPVNDAIVIPSSAVLSTGRRDVVWVEVDSNMFEPRAVVLGVHSESASQVLRGLREGESVVVSGGFMLESESQLQHPFVPGGDKPGAASRDPGPSAARPVGREANITVNGLFVPDEIHAKQGEPLRLNFYRAQESGCVDEVVFEKPAIRRKLASLRTTTIEFTPKKVGIITFTCGMGMVKGTIVVEK